jgi:hypothetical protein
LLRPLLFFFTRRASLNANNMMSKEDIIPRSIKTVSFTIRKRVVNVVKTGIYGSILYIYGSFSVRIKPYYRAQKYLPYLVVFTYFADTIQLVVLQCIVIVNGPCLQRKLFEILHELVIHRLTLLWWCIRVLQSLLVVAHYLLSYCIVYDFLCAVNFDLGLE